MISFSCSSSALMESKSTPFISSNISLLSSSNLFASAAAATAAAAAAAAVAFAVASAFAAVASLIDFILLLRISHVFETYLYHMI